ncbi:P-loop NTPase fold protein [Sorangium sp. So ce124]|uniref:P-loop NTPase fold protein n=1 Tax=Sorangium sp. So ce124 TaxID=3133280 RepID=UPI003F60D77F
MSMTTTTTTIQFLDDGEAKPQSVEVSDALAAAVGRAAEVNQGKDPFLVSFTSLLIGLVTAPDEVGEWLRAQIDRPSVGLDVLLHRRGLRREDLDRLAAADESALLARPLPRSSSARRALDEGQRRARAHAAPVDTRHVLAAYLTLPDYHEGDFHELGIARATWAAAFSRLMAERYPHEGWAAPAASAPPATTAAPPSDAAALDLSDPRLESQVVRALKEAFALAGSQQVLPSHVLTAVVNVSEEAGSAAFERFARMAPLARRRRSPIASDQTIASEELIAGDESAVLALDAGRLDEQLRRQLAWAQRPRAGETAPHPVWGRDLVTAALLCSGEAAATLEKAGRSLDVMRDLWHAFVSSDAEHRSRDEWNGWWRAAGVPLPGPRRAGYATETDSGDDKLGIEAEARAFARLILDRDVEAPLSIGLLGDWGSGKSFFIEQIKKQIAVLKGERHPELYTKPVEIEFNAWHASDANLWASLVTNIFDEIWEKISPRDHEKSPEEARRKLLEKIEEARGAVHEAETQVALGRAALAKAEKDLERRRSKLAWFQYARSITRERLAEIAKAAGFHEPLDTINAVDAAARSLADSGNRLRLVVAALLERPLRYIALPTALMAAAVVGVWLLVEAYFPAAWAAQVVKWAAALIGAVGALVGPLQAASSNVSGLADKLTEIRDEYDRELKKQSDETIDELTNARRELESAEASVAAAKARLGELLNQQATLDPRRRLGAFLQERVQSTQYRSQQGIIALVHKDFRKLSTYMKDLRESQPQEDAGEGAQDDIEPFDRIVLYVDDLDRCRPDQVVNTLEAIHLLLALDLFVVVVAVDSRWLIRALEVHYRDLLVATDGPLRASTPQCYLEKIFQITYALSPMDPQYFSQYVAFLAGAGAGAEKRKVTQGAPPRATGAPRTVTQRAGAAPAGTQTIQAEPERAAAGTPWATVGPAPKALPAHSVRIDKGEQEFICRLVPLLPTPRIAKRLVNVYRVIKAGKDAAALDRFERERRSESCLLMLAILFGQPVVASALLRALHEGTEPFDDREQSFVEAVRKREALDGEPAYVHEEWARLHATLQGLNVAVTVGECAREPEEVARYSLVSGHDWHTWARPSPSRSGTSSAKAS